MRNSLVDYGIPWDEGEDSAEGEDLPIGNFSDRFRHLYVLGKSRTGKSTVFLNLIRKSLDYGMIVVDPAGNMAPTVAGMIEDKDRLVYVDKAHPLIINPLDRYDNWELAAEELAEIVDGVVTATTASEKFTVLMKELLRNAVRMLEGEEKNFDGLYKFLTYSEIRKDYINKKSDEYWENIDQKKDREFEEKRQSAKRAATRLSEFFDTPTIRNFLLGKDQFSPKEIAENKKVVVFNIHGFSHIKMAFLGNLITHAVKTYYQHEASEKSPPLFLYIDEFHLFMSEAFSQMLAECGKYNISLNLSHHTHRQINQSILDSALSNCYTKMILNCGFQEARRMSQEYQRSIERFMSLREHEALLQIGVDTYHIHTFPPPDVEPYWPDKECDIQHLKERQPAYNFLRESWFSC